MMITSLHRVPRLLVVALCGVVVSAAAAHDPVKPGPVIIDTDMGLDDTVALTVALQHPALKIEALVVTPGAQSADQAATFAERLIDRFNRSDVSIFAAPSQVAARTQAARFVAPALDTDVAQTRERLTPAAYRSARGETTIIALGPLTNLAATIARDADLAQDIERVVIPGYPTVAQNWNLQADPDAFAQLQATEVPLVFVTPDENAAKPDGWSIGTAAFGPGDSLGEMFLRELFHESTTRTHYLEALDRLYDELAVLYVVRPQLFETTAESPKTVTPQSRVALFGALREALVAGRQARPRILFVDGPLPDDVFKPAVRERRAQIIAKHGETEWFAQLLLNELHQHAGAYSIIGVKMALRAAEILNAPQHGMKILSQTDPVPPVSCINDGFIVATGSTPGRALFARGSSGERGATQATFAYNGRQVTLRLKPEYQAKIRKHIQELLSKYELEDDEYWHGVEHLALDVWENWHRREIFDRRDEPQTAARE